MRPGNRPRQPLAPSLIQPLESRRLLTTLTVDDDGGAGVYTTIQAALDQAATDPNVTSIEVEPGTYRATGNSGPLISFPRGGLSLRAADGPGTVFIKGSKEVGSDFTINYTVGGVPGDNGTPTTDDDVYRITDWANPFFDPQDSDKNDARGKVRNQFFVGDHYLRMYDSVAALRAADFAADSNDVMDVQGGFFIDKAAGGTGVHHVYIRMRDGSDPDASGRSVEGTVTDKALLTTNGQDNLLIQDLDFLHGAHRTQGNAMLRIEENAADSSNKSADITLDGISVRYAHGAGLTVHDSSDVTVQDCTFNWNGQVGIHGNNLTGDVQFLRNITSYNNQLPGKTHGIGWEAGAFKISNSAGSVFDGHYSSYNGGNGMWFDVGDHNMTIRNSVSHHNVNQGLSYEISYGAKIYNNLFYANQNAGVIIHASAYNEVYNNVAYGNGTLGIYLKTGWNGSEWRTIDGYEITTYGNKLYNNIIANNQAENGYSNYEKSYSVPYRPTKALPSLSNPLFLDGNGDGLNDYPVAANQTDYNLFWLDPALGHVRPEFFVGDGQTSDGIGIRPRSLAAYQANGNFASDMHSAWGDPLFADPANGDFTTQAGSPARGLGLTLALSGADRNGTARKPGLYDAGAVQASAPALPAGWTASAIYSIAAGAAYTGRDGRLYLEGSGHEFGGASDKARFAWRDVTGNSAVSARYLSNDAANDYAKAGVMFRNTNASTSEYVALHFSDTGQLIFSYRPDTTSSGATVATASNLAAPVTMKLVREGSTFRAYYSTDDGGTWTELGNGVTVAGLGATAKAGVFANSRSNSETSLTTFDKVYVAELPAGLTAQDIGNPGVAGLSYVQDGRYYIAGSGSNIGGTADKFQYVSGDWSGDGTFTVKVESLENTGTYAKSGIMLRESTAVGSKFAYVFLTPGQGVRFLWRSTTGGSASPAAIANGITGPVTLKLVRSGDNYSAHYSTDDGQTWTQVGSTQNFTMNASLKAGLAVSAYNNAVLNHSVLSNYQVSGAGTGLTLADVGAVGVAGSSAYAPAEPNYTLHASGTGTQGGADEFSYLYKQYTADVTLSTRVDSLGNTHANARAGLMFRPSTADDKKYVSLSVDGSNTIHFQYRLADGTAPATSVTVSGVTGPVYLRLTRMFFRSGQDQYAYVAHYSTDNINWTQIGTTQAVNISASPFFGGLFATSGDDNTATRAVFSEVLL